MGSSAAVPRLHSTVAPHAPLSLSDRVASYLQAFPQCDDAVCWVAGNQARGWIYGVWQLGNYFKNPTRYYGSFPHGVLARILALYPDIDEGDILHAFSGALPRGRYTRLDLNPANDPELVGNVYDVASLTPQRFQLVIADPQYSDEDGKKYGTPPLDRGRAIHALATVTRPGGHLVWLDTAWPMHRKQDWHYYGAIEIRRSTNHRIRGLSLFERRR